MLLDFKNTSISDGIFIFVLSHQLSLITFGLHCYLKNDIIRSRMFFSPVLSSKEPNPNRPGLSGDSSFHRLI